MASLLIRIAKEPIYQSMNTVQMIIDAFAMAFMLNGLIVKSMKNVLIAKHMSKMQNRQRTVIQMAKLRKLFRPIRREKCRDDFYKFIKYEDGEDNE